MNGIIAVGYIRCSTEMQDDSPEQQRKEIESFGRTKGYSIIEWFVDFGVSGTTYDRPEFKRLWKTVEAGAPFTAVICYDESRWGRAINSDENTFWRVRFRKHGVDVVLVKTAVDPQHEFAPMLSALEGIQASQYSKKLSELTLRGAQSNETFSNGGTAPYGYCRVAINQKTGDTRRLRDGEWCVSGQEKVKFEPGDEDEIATVREIFNQRAQSRSLISIAQELNFRGVPCPKRGHWKNLDRKWSTVTIKTIIENPTYYGAWVYNRNSMSRIRARNEGRTGREDVRYPHWRLDRNAWIIVEDAYVPLVTKELWRKANSVGGTPISRSPNKHSAPYLLSGLTRCSRCGFAYQGQSTIVGSKRYFRYVCGGYNGKRVCQYFAVNRDALEGFVLQSIRSTISDPEFLSFVVMELQRLIDSHPDEVSRKAETIKQQLADLSTREMNLIQAIEGGISLGSIRPRLDELRAEKSRLEDEARGNNTERITEDQVLDAASAVKAFVADFEKQFGDGPLPLRKQIIRQCVKTIEIDPENSVARCYVHRIPPLTPALLDIQADQPKNEKAPGNRTPFRRAVVAGGGTVSMRGE
jgi:site-specific DNA recombinase